MDQRTDRSNRKQIARWQELIISIITSNANDLISTPIKMKDYQDEKNSKTQLYAVSKKPTWNKRKQTA